MDGVFTREEKNMRPSIIIYAIILQLNIMGCAPDGENPQPNRSARKIRKPGLVIREFDSSRMSSETILLKLEKNKTEQTFVLTNENENQVFTATADYTTRTFDVTYLPGASYVLDDPVPVPGTVVMWSKLNPLEEFGPQHTWPHFVFKEESKKIEFTTQPPYFARLRISYKHEPLLNNFVLPLDPLEGSVQATINGIAASEVTMDGRNVTIEPRPPQGATIDISFQTLKGPKLRYEIGTAEGDVRLVDPLTQEEIPFTYEDGVISIDHSAFKLGRTLVAEYSSTKENSFPLPSTVVDDSVKIEGPSSCALGRNIIIEDKILKVNCDFPEETNLKVTYDYVSDSRLNFTVDQKRDPESGTWEVFVNNEETTDFTRIGNEISFSKLPPKAKIKVIFTPNQ
jgi:hypothetical protein